MLATRMSSTTTAAPPPPGPPPSDHLPSPPGASSSGLSGAYPSSLSHQPNAARASSSSSAHQQMAQQQQGRSPISTSHPAHMGSLRRRQDQSSLEADYGGAQAAGGSLSSRHQASPFASSSASTYDTHPSQSSRADQPRSYSAGTSYQLHSPASPSTAQHAYASSSSKPATSSSSRRADHSLNPESASGKRPSTSSHGPSSRATSGNHVRSKHLLSHALELAQRAVDLDQAMRFPEALALYKETVLRLGEVMARVAATEKRRLERDGDNGGASNPDEGRSLREIHDAYRARIVLLESEIPPSPTATVTRPASPLDPLEQPHIGVGSAIQSLYERSDLGSPTAFQGAQSAHAVEDRHAYAPPHEPSASSAANGVRRTNSTSSTSSSRSHGRTMSLPQSATGPRVEVDQGTPRPRSSSKPVYRSPLPPPTSAPPPPPPLPTSNRFSGTAFVPSHSPHSSISSLTNGADPSASSGSQPPTPSTYGSYPRGSPPFDVNNSPQEADYAAQVRRRSLLESLRAAEDDGGVGSFTAISKSTSDRSLAGSVRNRQQPLSDVRESPERTLGRPYGGDDREPRSSEDTESGVEMLARTPLQAGFRTDLRTAGDVPAVPSSQDEHASRRSVDSTRSNESRGSRLGRSMNAHISPRASVDEMRPPIPPRRSSSNATPRQERDSLISPKTIVPGSVEGAQPGVGKDDKPIWMSTTDEGTISQRRREATGVFDMATRSHSARVTGSSDGGLRAETLPMQRSSSAEPQSPPNGLQPTEFGAGAGIAGGSSTASHSKASSLSTRLRALSQPGRRPAMQSNPSSSSNETPRPAPPVPTISRKASFASQTPSSAPSTSTANYPAAFATTHNRLNPPPSLAITRSFSSSSSILSNQPRSAVPSVGGGGQSVFLSATRVHTGLHSPQPPLAPEDLLHRPFHLLRLIRLTMYDSGAYLTRKLFVGSEVWTQGGSKLLHLDTKIQVMHALSSHLETLAGVSESLLPEGSHSSYSLVDGSEGRARTGKSPSPAQVGVEFVRMLDDFETTMEVGRTTLEKKVGSLGPMKPKARGAASLAAWGSKLSRSFDRMANGKNDGSLHAYVEALETLCLNAQLLDLHLQNFTSSSASSLSATPNPSHPETLHPHAAAGGGLNPAYRELPESMRNQIKTRLVGASQFFGLIVTVVLRDVGLLVERHGKMYGQFLQGP